MAQQEERAEWATTLVRFAYPVFGALNVASIDTPLVLRVLRPILTDKRVTASRLRGRIEAVLDFATAAKYRPEAANPARWSNHLEHLLASPTKRQIAPHAAMPHPEVPALVAQLRTLDGVPPRAFEFLMLTATRSAETLGATWNEIDLDKAVWTVPGHRMKAGKEHKVPLSARCIEILREMEGLQTGVHGVSGLREARQAGSADVPVAVAAVRPCCRDGTRVQVLFSATGVVIAPTSPAKSARPPSHIPSATRPKNPIVAATRWRGGAS